LTSPAADKRDTYRMEVDRAVEQFGVDRKWSAAQIAKAKRICYRTCWTESDWFNWANPSVPESILVIPNDGYPPRGADHLSVGLYQQQPQWWGSVVGSMDPFTATVRFLTAMLRDAPDWLTDNESNSCQRVQRSQFDSVTIDPSTGKPYGFGANYAAKTAFTDALEADSQYFAHHG
jgi:hypothetical protein